MRVAIGGFWHETNTFNPLPTTRSCFEEPPGRTWVGEMDEAFAGAQPVLAGFATGLRDQGLEVEPAFFASAGPFTGTITTDAFEWAAERLETSIRASHPDAVLLHLHGAGASEAFADPEAELLRRIRATIGPDRPIVTVNDAHANVGPRWLDFAAVAIAYKTTPHLDMTERGIDAAAVIGRLLRGEIRPAAAIRKPPILLKGGLMSLTEVPLALIKPPLFWLSRRAAELERDPRVVNISINAGFGDADVPEAGISILVHTDGAPELAAAYADELAALAWQLRQGFDTSLVMTPPAEAVERALGTEAWPVVLADQGNNAAGGSPGDGTAILTELIARRWPDAALFIRDPAAVAACVEAGVGGRVELAVGGHFEPSNGEICQIEGRVQLLADRAESTTDPFANPGRVAVVRCGATDLILTQHPTSQIGPEYFRRYGVEPREKRIIVVQSAAVFRHRFEVLERVARSIIEVDTPGITNPDPRRFQYRNIRRPIFPLDESYPDGLTTLDPRLASTAPPGRESGA